MRLHLRSSREIQVPELLRIGIFTDFYVPQVNGVAVSLKLVVEGLRAAGHSVTVFAPQYPGYDDNEPNIFRTPSLRYLSNPPFYLAVPGTPRITWSLTRQHFDVLHAHSPITVGLLAYVTATVKNLPLIYTYHTSIEDYTHYVRLIGDTRVIRRAGRWFSTTSTNLGDQIVVPSAKFKRLLLDQNVRRPIHVIPNGIDLSTFYQAPAQGMLHARLGLPPETPLLLTVGRLAPEKYQDFLIRAFEQMPERSPAPHLVFAGDGSARSALEAQAAASPLRKRIHFLGMLPRAELPGILHDATVFVSASTTETQSLCHLEAISAGLPIVAVKDDAFEGMLVDGENGVATPPDERVFVTALVALLDDPARREQFSRRSVELSHNFSVEGQVQALVTLYKEAVKQNQQGWAGFRGLYVRRHTGNK